jgi:hypothetical protein
MSRFHTTSEGNIAFTDEEELVRDVEEAEWHDNSNNRKSDEVRTCRNALLTQSDWTQVEDAPVDKAAWANYRQALRDITLQKGFPFNVDFPNPVL